MSQKKTSVTVIDEAIDELLHWRARNELTQREAAEVLSAGYFHITYNSLRSFEAGYRRPAAYTAKILLRFLRDHPRVQKRTLRG